MPTCRRTGCGGLQLQWDAKMLADKKILLIIGGGIAAYKSLDLIRRLKERGAASCRS
jgi:hypothetical protein